MRQTEVGRKLDDTVLVHGNLRRLPEGVHSEEVRRPLRFLKLDWVTSARPADWNSRSRRCATGQGSGGGDFLPRSRR